jgi:hypothetical protein
MTMEQETWQENLPWPLEISFKQRDVISASGDRFLMYF